jgi:hypothetical protein
MIQAFLWSLGFNSISLLLILFIMYHIDEIAPDLYRISVFVPQIQLQFNHFLIKDDEPLLYHAGLKQMFPILREAVQTLIDPRLIRWVGYSHFEVDECGALNDWLQIAPNAQAICSEAGAIALTDKDILEVHKSSMLFLENGPLMDYTPYNHKTKAMLFELAALQPKTLATMHGSSFFGDCSKALIDLNDVMKEIWGDKAAVNSKEPILA